MNIPALKKRPDGYFYKIKTRSISMPKLLTLYLNYNITSDKNQKLLHCKCKIHALFVCESTTLDI